MMPGLTALVPLPWRLAALGAFALALFGTGFVLGLKAQTELDDAREARADRAVKVITRTVNHETVRVETKFVERKAARVTTERAVATEVANHAALPDPVLCHLDPQRVSTINRAWGVGTDPADGNAGVPDPATPQVGGASGSGAVDNGARRGLSGLLRRSPAPDRAGATAGKTAGGGQ